jgi:exonuclease III
VYGPVKVNLKQQFLDELEGFIQNTNIHVLVGGDFNLVRKIEEKSSGNANSHWMNAFNEFVARIELRELHRSGGQYT